MTNKIYYIKFNNGQELVAQQAPVENPNQERDSNIVEVLADACIVFLAPSHDGQAPQVSMAPYAPFTDDKTIPLNRKDMQFVTTANKELADFYKQATGKTTIVTPNKPSIITNTNGSLQ